MSSSTGSARDFTALVASGVGKDSETGVVQRLLMQAQTAVGSYAEPSWAAEHGHPRLTGALLDMARSAEAGVLFGDLRLPGAAVRDQGVQQPPAQVGVHHQAVRHLAAVQPGGEGVQGGVVQHRAGERVRRDQLASSLTSTSRPRGTPTSSGTSVRSPDGAAPEHRKAVEGPVRADDPRSVPIGPHRRFSDDFAAEHSYHMYKIVP